MAMAMMMRSRIGMKNSAIALAGPMTRTLEASVDARVDKKVLRDSSTIINQN